MKKLICGITFGLAAAGLGLAQGNVLFFNNNASKISVSEVPGGPTTLMPANDGTVEDTFYFALFYSPTAATVEGNSGAVTGLGPYAFEDPNWTLAETADGPAIGENGTQAGRFASLVTDSDGFTTTLDNPDLGSSAHFVVVGWSGNIGSTVGSLESFLDGTDGDVTSGFIGESDVTGLINFGDEPIIPDAEIMSQGSYFANGFVLSDPVVAPEPTTIALGVLGATSLLTLRRKQG